MSNHGLRRVFSLLLAVMMVCTLLPTAVFAEDTVEQQPVVTDEQQPVVIGEPSGTVSDGQDTNQSDVPLVEEDKEDGELVDENVKNDVQPEVKPYALDTGHTLKVRFQVLYLDDTLYTGYRYGTTESTTFVCQYKTPHSDTGATNHTIAISDIKSAVGRADVESGYTISGWTKTASANPQVWPFTVKEPTACMSGQTIYLVAKKTTPTAPSKPTKDQVVALQPVVRVTCTNDGSRHGSTEELLTADAITNIGDVTATDGVYTCTVTVKSDAYVEKFVASKGMPHSPTTESKTFTLTYKDGKWTKTSSPAVTFKVACLQKPPKSDVEYMLMGMVKVQCTTNSASHPGKQYNLKDGSYSWDIKWDETNGYTCDVSVSPSQYVTDYNETYGDHTYTDEDQIITLRYREDSNAWSLKTGQAAVFYVECKTAPEEPSKDVVENLLKQAVTVRCKSNSSHEEKKYDLIDGSYSCGKVEGDETSGYTCAVKILPAKYVEAYNQDVADGHTASPTYQSKTFKLKYDSATGTWSVTNPGCVFYVECKTAPKTPGAAVLNDLGLWVKFNCTEDGTHGKTCLVTNSDVKDGYSVTPPVEQVDGKYRSTLTVNPQPYFDHLYGSAAPAHTLQENDSKTVTLTYDPATDKWSASDTTVEFSVKCEPVIEPPVKPDIEKLFEKSSVNVACKNTDANHSRMSYPLMEGSYETTDVTGDPDTGYSFTITIYAEKYVQQYNTEMGATHVTADGAFVEATYTVIYNEKGEWVLENPGFIPPALATFSVKCETAPKAPKQPTTDDVVDLHPTVAVKCTTGHGDLTYTVRSDNFTPDTITVGTMTGDDTTGYTCIITVRAAEYVKYFNENKQANGVTHTLADDAEKTFTMTYKDGKWTGPTNPAVTFEVKCETVPETTYTVTYTDGVENEEVFADQVTKDLKSGAATPEFSGKPTRKNYVFAGWKPEVAKTVTADATYVAQWKEDFNNNGKPDDEEERYTVTYKDGVSGKVFKDEVHSDLLPGVDTPDFGGKLTRKGYTFAGWSPKVSKTVTKDVTYTATWKATSSTGKDKVPKTGDSGMVLILGSVMLFSFCGATAVYVFDRKRKQG